MQRLRSQMMISYSIKHASGRAAKQVTVMIKKRSSIPSAPMLRCLGAKCSSKNASYSRLLPCSLSDLGPRSLPNLVRTASHGGVSLIFLDPVSTQRLSIFRNSIKSSDVKPASQPNQSRQNQGSEHEPKPKHYATI